MRLASVLRPIHHDKSRSSSSVANDRDLPPLRQRLTNRKPWSPARYWLTAFSRLPLRRALTTRPSSFLASWSTTAICSAESWAACSACSWTVVVVVVTSDMVDPPQGCYGPRRVVDAVGRLFRRGAKCPATAFANHPP